ncbi:MAG: hypothetical protein K8U57_30830 [Planctomycetes bacterium]|nr:hypothetical protein [Planctomycetota bacterium]
MSLLHYPGRLLIVTTASSLLLLVASVGVAMYVKSEQARTANILGEDVESRRAAANLEETLLDLIALHASGVTTVQPLHDRIARHLRTIEEFADKQDEREMAWRVADSFAEYRSQWQKHGSAWATQQLRTQILPACEQLREFNATQIEESERNHRQALRWMGWGFVAVGVLGSVAGVVLGYGLARGLRRAVNSLLVRVQGASDLLGQELATVRVERDGAAVTDGVEDLVARVEHAVETLQQREREVRRSERLAAVGQLAAGVAHEIRNPLTSVQLLIQTARKDPTVGGLNPEDLSLIDDELGRIERSLKVFIDYARPPKLERISCDLGAVLEGSLKLVRGRASQQGVTLRFSPPSSPIIFDADVGQLRQVIVNLLLNALDAMPNGGTLEVIARRNGSSAEFEVSDSGKGISPEMLPRLFEPFATGKETGLGEESAGCRRFC